MSMISEAASRPKYDDSGYDVIGAIESLKTDCAHLSAQIQALHTDIGQLTGTITQLTAHTHDIVAIKQGEADRITAHTLDLLHRVQTAAEELDTVSMDSLKERLVTMSKQTLVTADKTLKTIEAKHQQTIKEVFSRTVTRWLMLAVLLGALTGLGFVLGEYLVRGAAVLFESEAACVLLLLAVLGLIVWIIIYTVLHRKDD